MDFAVDAAPGASYRFAVAEELTKMGFAARFSALRAKRGPFCLGLDPTPALLRAYGLRDDVAGLRAFCERVIDAAEQNLAVIKPQVAYFERFGPAGLQVLWHSVRQIQAAGTLALLDVKRGDIGSTCEAYADAWLGDARIGDAGHGDGERGFGGDAMTLHAYLGYGALQPFVARASATGAGLFIVVLSSNPEGARIQNAQVAPGLSVAQSLSDEITRANEGLRAGQALGPIGAVVGLTGEGATSIASRLPRSLLLVPGLGAQGGSFEQLAERFGEAKARAIPSASRSVLAKGPEREPLRAAILEHCEQAARALG